MLVQNCRAESNSCMYHVYQQLRVYFKFYSQHPKKGIFAQQNSFDLQALLQYTKKIKFVNCNFFASLFYKSVEFDYG